MSSDGQYRPLNIPCPGIPPDPRIAELEAELQAHALGVQEAKYERERTEHVVSTNLQLQARLATVVGAAQRVLDRIDFNGGIGEYRGGPAFVVKDLRDALSSPPIAIVARQESERTLAEVVRCHLNGDDNEDDLIVAYTNLAALEQP